MVKINKENNLYTVREDGGACDVLFVTTRIADLVAWYRRVGYATFCAGSNLPGNAYRALMAAFTAQATRPAKSTATALVCSQCGAHVASNAVIVRGGEPCCAKCAKGVRAYSKLHGVR